MARGKRAIIIGAGVIGVTSAWALARKGWQVKVLDAYPQPGSGASRGNGRQLSYSYTDALAQPHLLRSLPQLALGMDPAFRMAMPRDPGGFAWLLSFLRNSTQARFRSNTLECLALAEQSRQELHGLLAQHDIAFSHRRPGKLVLYRDRAAFERARQVMELKAAHGASLVALAAEQVAQIEPALAGFEGLAGAIHAPEDETGDCAQFTRTLMQLAEREFGAGFEGGKAVASLRQNGAGAVVSCGDGAELVADLAVICSGYRSNELLAPLGHRLPIAAMKGYSFIAPALERAPRASVTDSSRRIVFTNLVDRVLVAGFADLGIASADKDEERLAQLQQAAMASLPAAAHYDEASELWSGHRPVTPQSLPHTRMLEPWLAVNGGHGMLGWTLAMGSAARLAQRVEAAF